MWTRGDQVVLRYRDGNRVTSVAPVTVVEDTDAYVALYLAVGTPVKLSIGDDGLPIPRALPYEERTALRWRLGDGFWRGHSQLWFARPGAAHAIGAFWSSNARSFAGWYVDLQAPLTRTSVGFDTVDYVLDIVIAPDRSWQWKDEDEFAAAPRSLLIGRGGRHPGRRGGRDRGDRATRLAVRRRVGGLAARSGVAFAGASTRMEYGLTRQGHWLSVFVRQEA